MPSAGQCGCVPTFTSGSEVEPLAKVAALPQSDVSTPLAFPCPPCFPSHQRRPSLIAERLGGPCASSLAATVRACTKPPPGAQTNTDERDPTATRTTNRRDTSEGEHEGHDP